MLAIALLVIEVVYGFHGGIGRYIAGMRLVNGDHDPDYLAYMGGHLRYRFPTYFGVAYLLNEPVAALVLAGRGCVQGLRGPAVGHCLELGVGGRPPRMHTVHIM